MTKRTYQFVMSADEIQAPESDNRFIAVDLETTGLNFSKDKIHGISFCMADGQGYYTTNIPLMEKVLADESWTKIFHNAAFDVTFLELAGLPVHGCIHDTLILANLIDPDGSNGLKALARRHLGEYAVAGDAAMNDWLTDKHLGRDSIVNAPHDVLVKYAAEDAINTFELFPKLCAKLSEMETFLYGKGLGKSPLDVYAEEDSLILRVVIEMQKRGIVIDLNRLAALEGYFAEQIKSNLAALPNNEMIHRIEEARHQANIAARLAKNKTGKLKKEPKRVSFNWDSPKDLQALLYGELGEPIKHRTEKKNPKLDDTVLVEMLPRHPWLQHLIDLRTFQKLQGTYLENYKEIQLGGVIRAHFNITGTATGRFSSSDPNLQNLPKHGNVKRLFVPRPGHKFIYADYSQLELRIAAHLSGDEAMIKEYCSESPDLHSATAAATFSKKIADVTKEERALGKTVNFAIIYKASAYRLAQILGYFGDLDLDLCREIKDKSRVGKKLSASHQELLKQYEKALDLGAAAQKRLFTKYSGLKAYIDSTENGLHQDMFCCTDFGRVRRLPDLEHPEYRKRSHCLKAGFNMKIQSYGASLTKRAMIALSAKYSLISQIHDAIILEVPEGDLTNALNVVQWEMENVARLRVPLVVEPKVLNSLDEEDVYECQTTKKTA